MEDQVSKKKKWWNFGTFRAEPLIEAKLTTEVPIDVAIEKLRGFVTDQHARIISVRENRLEIEISSEKMGLHRRAVDRPAPFRVELEFMEERLTKTNSFGLAAGNYAQTAVKVVIRPKRKRDRRQEDQADRARLILQSLKAYLMAKEIMVDADGHEADVALAR